MNVKVISARYTGVCRVCGEVITAKVPAEAVVMRPGRPAALLTKYMPDAFAHAWTHDYDSDEETSA